MKYSFLLGIIATPSIIEKKYSKGVLHSIVYFNIITFIDNKKTKLLN